MIEIRESFRPFSHLPGASVVVPSSSWVIQIFPALLRVQGGKEWSITLTGPVEDFTVQMDLERECVWIWGRAKEGYFRYQIKAQQEGLFLCLDRGDFFQIGDKRLQKKETFLLAKGEKFFSPKPCEKLFLGSFKTQDWELMRRRADSKEFAPMLFLLGQKVMAKETLIDTPDLRNFFLGAFSSLFMPHLEDPLHQGINLPKHGGDPLSLLVASYQKIRKFLIEGMQILPDLPKEWEAGKATGLQTSFGLVDLLWRKGRIYQMVLHADQEVDFVFAKVSSFRRRVQKGKVLFDRFQK